MFGLRKSERQAYEAHIASLTEQVHWLRSCLPWVVPIGGTAPAVPQLGSGTLPPLAAPVNDPDDILSGPRGPLAPMTDEEEDVLDAFHRGELDKEEATAILKTLGIEPESIEFK